ncbi:PREDICTED: GRIP and coiled-coil domain-containing protein 2 [Nicrophorus vespilloides]|uniref:GRIP and coiled-coil domain-containing protein 2 n=1 Tax=Nicrophorus vespilloides TaxID=110193 RepID=A0ABM1MQ71_NICVS|nr:PREDICTED: GRIP and coiled-coil domain-containing protein 2 [Nicrophorus vespilloides]
MDVTIESGGRKSALEDLSKEDLIKKCRNLLAIAQKAKQAKDVVSEENVKLKEQIKNTIGDEIIENLTQQKLAFVTSMDELKQQNNTLKSSLEQQEHKLLETESKVSDLDTENQSFRRQVTRLTDENEQLITHLDGLEKQIDELEKMKVELEVKLQIPQKEQNNSNNEKIIELQNMLSVSLNEVQKLKDENEQLINNVSSLNVNITEQEVLITNLNEQLKGVSSENTNVNKIEVDQLQNEIESFKNKVYESAESIQVYQQQIDIKNKEIECHSNLVDDLNTEIHKNRALNEKLQQDVKCMSQRLNDNQIVSSGIATDLQNTNEKLKGKLKMYHAKMIKFAIDIKHLKESKEYILNNFKSYNQQVKSWREQLIVATKKLSKEINENDIEKSKLNEYIVQLKEELSMKENPELKFQFDDVQCRLENLQVEHENAIKEIKASKDEEIAHLEKKLSDAEQTYANISDEMKTNKEKLNTATKQLHEDNVIKNELIEKVKSNEKLIEDNNKLISELRKAIEHLENQVDLSKSTESKLAEQTGNEIYKLSQENKKLFEKNEHLEAKLHELQENSEELEKINSIKRENAELLTEMNEMNQALKERGETISKQQAYCDEILKKISVYEVQANKNFVVISENNDTIESLKKENVELKTSCADLRSEVASIKDKLSENAECDTLSTSTISHSEEVNRLKDLDGSWEQRYGKLRALALNLKAKVTELTKELNREQTEKSEIQQKLGINIKSIQSIQAQCDIIQDELDASKTDNKNLLKKIESFTKDRQQLLDKEEIVMKLKLENENLIKEKGNVNNWKKQVSLKVQTLKKEIEANSIAKKDFEGRIHKLTVELESRDRALKDERESHSKTKNSLQESNNECKKQSVLNLEIQDFEKTIKELTQKLEKKNELITKLKNQNDSQKSSVNALKDQTRLFEDKANALEMELSACHIEVNTFKKNIIDLESLLSEKDFKIQEVVKTLEISRGENEDLSTQLSKIIAEHQKNVSSLKEEKDLLRGKNLGFEQRLMELENKLELREDELTNIENEYKGYKVRAQSVLRQNQSRDVGLEEKLSEEAATLRAQVDIFKAEIDMLRTTQEKLTNELNKVSKENENYESYKIELLTQLEDGKKEYEKLNTKYYQTMTDHSEAVRSLKLNAETLAQCYRQQISEQEVRHNREIIELQSKLEKSNIPLDIPTLLIPSTPREEGEGSESVDSTNGNIHPLEKLLGGDQEHEISFIKKQLNENESKVTHLTALLADTEQDLAKHVQMNKVLKEEIRRQQRSVEREKHAENLEYMKNVVFKFITLSNGDERQRLVPVLNTILKLSPDETQKLNMVARNDKSWSNYLPIWSKPQ